MAELELIGSPRSIYVRTVRLALHEKGVEYRNDPVQPHDQAVCAINPFGLIPALRHGDMTLFETRAITLYIDRSFQGPPLVPVDIVAAARVEQWISALATVILPCWGGYTRAKYFPDTTRNVDLPDLVARMERQMLIVSEAISPSGFLAGECFTLADMELLPILAYLQTLPESARLLEATPGLLAYFHRHAERPTWLATVPPPFPAKKA